MSFILLAKALVLMLFPGGSQDSDEYALFFLVDAKHLNYKNTTKLIRSMDLAKGGDVGHAWIALVGKTKGKVSIIEGGHSGETGQVRPKYIEGILGLVNAGDPDPVKYLWTSLGDGYFEEGGGYHKPSLVAKKELTREEYERLTRFIDPAEYDFKEFSITERNCARFVADVANEVGIELDFEIVVPVQKWVLMKGRRVSVYEDPAYREISIGSADKLIVSLREAIKKKELSYGKRDLARLRRLYRKQEGSRESITAGGR